MPLLRSGSAWNSIQLIRVSENWPVLRGSLLLRFQLILINALYLRGRAALAAAACETPPGLRESILKAADHDARQIEREGMAWSDPLAQIMRAAAAATRGDTAKALDFLSAAEDGFAVADMALFLAVSRRRRGQLIAGDEGRRLMEAADLWMSDQDIRNPGRMADLLAPGGWSVQANEGK